MGCGQSKIHLYPRKSKSKANGKKGGHADSDAETDEDESYFDDPDKCQNREPDKPNEVTEEPVNKIASETDEEVSVSLLRAKNLSLLQSQEISTSQQNFFRMLDKKIEEGPDYDSASETELALEEARLNALVQHWESASLTASICSSASRSLQGTPIRQTPIKQLATPRSALKSAFGMPQTPTQLQQQQQQQVLTTTDYPQLGTSPHPPLQMTAVVGPIRSVPNPSSLLLTNLNSQMLQQMQNAAVSGQLPINLMSDATATTANTSNVLALMQTAAATSAKPPTQQVAHLLTLPAGTTGPLAIGKPNLSPKHLADGRMLIATSPLAQQIQQQQQQAGMPPMPIPSQYIATTVIAGASAPPPAIVGNGSRTQQQQQQMLPLQMAACYGQNPAAAAQPPAPHQHPADIPIESQSPANYGDIMHNVQAPPAEYRFPPAISVQRLAPQVQRQLRETQELIKDTCPQLYAAGYGSPGPPIRNPARNPNRRPTLETQLSQELS